jgi:glycosyltransferase 2 family protein
MFQYDHYLSQAKKRIFLIIIIIVSFYVLLAVFSGLDQFIKNLYKIDLNLLIPILLAFTATLFIKCVRQFILLGRIGAKISFKQNTTVYFAGLSLLITPGGLGQVIKSYLLSRNHGETISKTLPVVMFERYHDVLALFSIIMLLALLYKVHFLLTIVIIISAPLLLVPLAIKNDRLYKFIHRIVMKRGPLKKINNISSADFKNSLSLISSKKSLLACWLLSIAAWSFEAVGIFLCFYAFGQNVPIGLSTLVGFSSALFGAISLIPGGAGVTELVFVQLLSYNGLDLSIAVSIVFFYRLTSTWFSAGVGIYPLKLSLSKNPVNKNTIG